MAKIGTVGITEATIASADLWLQDVAVLTKGTPVAFDREQLRRLLAKEHVIVKVNLGNGPATATAWGCDLSKKYVEINTDYTT